MALHGLYMNDGGKSKVRCRFRADQSHFLSGCYINVSLCNMKRRDVTLTVANGNTKIRKVLCNELSLYKTKVN
jgi:hypothetical protein